MADQQDRPNVNIGENNNQNWNVNLPNNSNTQAWNQYWQQYYFYYMYYYTSYYYMALCQNSSAYIYGPSSIASSQLNGARVPPVSNPADWAQRPVNGEIFAPAFNVGQVNRPEERFEYKVAPLGKRVFAEFIDFVFLYFLKYSLFLLYYKDPDKLNSQFQYILVIDDNTSIKDLEDILLQALIYRFIVFLYEALYLVASFPCDVGGATLGKYMMGITVVSWTSLTPMQGQNMRRFTGSAKRLNFWQSCVRATLKNCMITFFFPIIFTTMFLQNLRTPYDFVANSVVVDARPKRVTSQN